MLFLQLFYSFSFFFKVSIKHIIEEKNTDFAGKSSQNGFSSFFLYNNFACLLSVKMNNLATR